MRKRILPWLALPVFLFGVAMILCGGKWIGEAVKSAMRLCAETLIPTLFPLAVLSAWLTRSGAAERIFYPWSVLFAKFVRTDPRSVSALILGLLCGYPIGAMCMKELYCKGEVSREDAEWLSACCTNAGPAFLIGVAGQKLLGSAGAGCLLLLVQHLASLITILLLRPQKQNATVVYRPAKGNALLSSFPESVASAANSMLNITGFVAIASVLCAAVRHVISNKSIAAMLCGILEVTNGLRAFSKLSISHPVKFVLFSAALGFSGICVHLQVASAFLPNSIGMRNYFAGKLFHAGCAVLLSLPIALLLKNTSVSVIALPIELSSMISPSLGTVYIIFSALYTFLWKFQKERSIIDAGCTSGGSDHVI